LLTLDEINNRFPAITYSELKATRARVGGNREHPITSSNRGEVNAGFQSDAEHHHPSGINQPTPNKGSLPPQSSENLRASQTTQGLGSAGPSEDASTPQATTSQPSALPTEACAICFEFFEDNDDVRELQCPHYFHQPCIDQWLTDRRAQCPLCKQDCVNSGPPN